MSQQDCVSEMIPVKNSRRIPIIQNLIIPIQGSENVSISGLDMMIEDESCGSSENFSV